MQRHQLEHIIRASAAITGAAQFVIVGGLEVHDLAASKLIAGREKDLDFVAGLFRHGLVVAKTIGERLAETNVDEPRRQLAVDRLNRFGA